MSGWTVLRDSWRKSGRLFLSLFAVAAFLPVLLMGALAPGGFNFLTEADEETPLRLWFEPGSAVARSGQIFTLKLMAEYEDKNKLIPRVSVGLKANGLGIEVSELNYDKAFVGRVELGEVEVTAMAEGEAILEVIEGSVNTTLPDLPVVTSPARITIRR